MTRSAIPGAYGSFTSSGGAALYATAHALRSLAVILRQRSSTELHLDPAPDDVVEDARIEQIKITISADDEKIVFRRENSVLEAAGGDASINKLAETLENLAEASRQIGDQVGPHVDLEYFPGHGFLAASSMWITVLMTADRI